MAMDARPGGPAAKREPSPEGLGINPEYDLSAVGAALNLGPLEPVSLAANSGFPTTLHSSTATYAAFFKESRMRFTETTKPDRKSGGRRGTCSSLSPPTPSRKNSASRPCQIQIQWFIIPEPMRLDSHQHFWHY